MLSLDHIGPYESRADQDFTHVISALRGIRFGSVEITIHDSQVVQIERREKLRFDRER